MLRAPLNRSLLNVTRRTLSSQASSSLPSSAYTDPTKRGEPSTSSTPNDITKQQKDALDAALRVDQAGEVAANYIYKGQLAVLGRHRTAGPLIQVNTTALCALNIYIDFVQLQEMWDQEKKHLDVMNRLQIQHNVRPTVLWEVAKVAGFGLGAVTALMGKEAAMACTEAVETVIGEHYDEYALHS